jgi:hypothetical protein
MKVPKKVSYLILKKEILVINKIIIINQLKKLNYSIKKKEMKIRQNFMNNHKMSIKWPFNQKNFFNLIIKIVMNFL